ncbi:hypothetical protein [Streptomyces fradiae]|uniref:hypothetical protein n=1 Tax=Streptomyces fradiae TaxID=1906 RepID=UPI0039880FB0
MDDPQHHAIAIARFGQIPRREDDMGVAALVGSAERARRRPSAISSGAADDDLLYQAVADAMRLETGQDVDPAVKILRAWATILDLARCRYVHRVGSVAIVVDWSSAADEVCWMPRCLSAGANRTGPEFAPVAILLECVSCGNARGGVRIWKVAKFSPGSDNVLLVRDATSRTVSNAVAVAAAERRAFPSIRWQSQRQ